MIRPVASLVVVLLLVVVSGLAAPLRPSGGAAIEGRVTHVRDGDTIEIGATAIRLGGVAAPERGDALGRRAGARMRELVLGRRVSCVPDGTRSYDRVVAACYHDGVDIGERLVAEGLARDCPRFSGGRYRPAEQQAAAGGAQIGRQYRLPGYCTPR